MLSERVAQQGCDICKVRPASRWFGLTSSIICNKPVCLVESERRYDKGIRDQEEQDEYAPIQY